MKNKSLVFVSVLLIIIVFVATLIFSPSGVFGKREAIDAVVLKYPELASYETTDLPPSSILSKETVDGWYLGFIRRGSGRPGIIDAKCFLVNNKREVVLTGEYIDEGSVVVENIIIETCMPIEEDVPLPTDSGLALGEMGVFEGVSIRPLEVIEDSRCPVDVLCIQAGTVRLKIEIINSIGSKVNASSGIVKLGESFPTEDFLITLVSVLPAPNSQVKINNADYRFTFTVTPKEAPVVTVPKGKCYIGGCSGQICSDREDMVSTCEYREEYACYNTAKCERQTTGECDWTQTASLAACLKNSM